MKTIEVMVALIETSQRLVEGHVKAQFDSTWYVTTIKDTSEQL
jgi:hypothetical protein